MTLRLALLFVSLLMLSLIGLICHIKYRQLNPKKRTKNLSAVDETDALLSEDVNAPFINENIISDIPEHSDTLAKPDLAEFEQNADAPNLKTSFTELIDQKKIARSIASELLPVYRTDDLIFEHVAVLPNVNSTAKQVKSLIDVQSSKLKSDIEITVQVKKQNEFLPLAATNRKQKISHLKSVLKFRQKSGVTDSQAIKEFENFIQGIAKKLSCEYQFALTTDEAIVAADALKQFIKEHDLIIILYILAKPEDSFSGEDLQKTLTEAQMEFGEFKFYHYFSKNGDNQHQKLFSVANMYKPGSFDLDSLDKFSTMGLCAFMVPALVNDPISAFSEMCTHTKQIADGLSGVLTTNQRELLNEENYKRICAQIAEHSAKLSEQGITSGDSKAFELFA